MSVDKILEDFGTKLVIDVRASLIANKVTFGGGGESKLSARTRFEIKTGSNGLVFNLVMPDYGYWVNKGRKPGPVSEEGQKSISEWVKRKGIVGKFQKENLTTRESQREKSERKLKPLKKIPFEKAVKALTYLIARKVATKGYEADHFLDEVLNDGRLKKLQEDVSKELKRQITIEIKR